MYNTHNFIALTIRSCTTCCGAGGISTLLTGTSTRKRIWLTLIQHPPSLEILPFSTVELLEATPDPDFLDDEQA